jgi:Reverse transcriptase (RNA-dependent DNA polymerase)
VCRHGVSVILRNQSYFFDEAAWLSFPWTTICLYLILELINGWETWQLDFVLAYPQADIEVPMYMDIPQGFSVGGTKSNHCLLLKKNLYDQKQAGRVWNHHLHDGLTARGFVQSCVDMCLYFRGNVALLMYTDDGILIAPTQGEIDEAIEIIRNPCTTAAGQTFKAFNITDEGTLNDYLGVKVEKLPNGAIKLSQPAIIQQILDDLGFNDKATSKSTPAASTVYLHHDIHGQPHDEHWHYRSIIGKLNFLEKST